MRDLLDFLHRHEPKGATLAHLKSGAGAIAGMTTVGALAGLTGLPLLLAPLGATSVLLFAQPESPLAQPANVLGGYLLAVGVSLAMILLVPDVWWVATIAVGLVIALMLLLRVTHPPAGALPLVALSSHMTPWVLPVAVLTGAVCLVAIAMLHHRLPPQTVYPRRVKR